MSKPQTTSNLGTQIRTQKQCKICLSPHRGEIEDLLVLRRQKNPMPNGELVTGQWMIDHAPTMWGITLNSMNMNTHYEKHFRVGKGQELQKQVEPDLKLIADLKAGKVLTVQPEEFLENIVAIANAKTLADPSSITVDHGLKATAELTRRRHDEQTSQLMMGLVGAVQKSITANRRDPDVIEAETVEELESESV